MKHFCCLSLRATVALALLCVVQVAHAQTSSVIRFGNNTSCNLYFAVWDSNCNYQGNYMVSAFTAPTISVAYLPGYVLIADNPQGSNGVIGRNINPLNCDTGFFCRNNVNTLATCASNAFWDTCDFEAQNGPEYSLTVIE